MDTKSRPSITVPSAPMESDSPFSPTRNNLQSPNIRQYTTAKRKLDELFFQWLSFPETSSLIHTLIAQAKSGKPLSMPAGSAPMTPGSPQSPRSPRSPRSPCSPLSPKSHAASRLISSAFSLSPQAKHGATPPLSPTTVPSLSSGSSASGEVPRRSNSRPESPMPAPQQTEIPKFYFPGRGRGNDELENQECERAQVVFKAADDSIAVADFREICVAVCRMPAFCGPVLFQKIIDSVPGTEGRSTLTLAEFMTFYDAHMKGKDDNDRFFWMLKEPANDYIVRDDFQPFMEELLKTHPGLAFLEPTREFQLRYMETVIERIYYCVNRSGTGRITLKELRRSDLLQVFQLVSVEEDINKIRRYFSYEHFYVVYCKFWELDTDHNLKIDRDDLLKYGGHALTYRIVDRIFSQCPRRFEGGSSEYMGYKDFIWFILSEEDKTSDTAQEYWFKCIDLDADNVVSEYEMEYFYQEQIHRMECLSQEIICFRDILCQMLDMVHPDGKTTVTLKDLRKQRKLGGIFFNVLFNLTKFFASESRDPIAIRLERQTPELTDWDRFAKYEYIRLSAEEEDDEDFAVAMDGDLTTTESSESPF